MIAAHVSVRRFSKKIQLVTNFKFKRSCEELQKYTQDLTTTDGGVPVTEDVGGLLLDAQGETAPRGKVERPYFNSRPRKRKAPFNQTKGQILYGVHPVTIALSQKKRDFHQLFLKRPKNGARRSDLEILASSCNVPTTYVDRYTLDNLSEGNVHQGICMDVGPLPLLVENLDSCWDSECFSPQHTTFSFPLRVLMENVKDPMNFGAVLRSAYFFGVDRVFCSKSNSCKLSPVVSKASSGAMEVMPLSSVHNVPEFLKKARESGWCTVATSARSMRNIPLVEINSFQFSKPVLLILGNEGSGISEEVLDWCDMLVSIEAAQGLEIHPMVNCLNVSAAAAVLFQVLMRKRLRNS